MPRTAAEFHSELSQLVRAKFPLIHVQTVEEDRAYQVIEAVAEELKLKILVWSTSRGVVNRSGSDPGSSTRPETRSWISNAQAALADLVAAIEVFERACTDPRHNMAGYLFVLLDPHPYLVDHNANPIYRRRLRDFVIDMRTKGWPASCIMMAPSAALPPELDKEVTIIDFPLPARDEVARHITTFVAKVRNSKHIQIDSDDHFIEELVEACIGLTMVEIDNVLSRALIDDRALNRADLDRIFEQKRQMIRRSGILEYIDTHELNLDDVGGLDVLKDWLAIRDVAFSPQARKFGIDPPKGVLVTGISGCGKSWSAKCVAASWRIPLVRLDMGKIFSSLVGSSEERMREAIRTCEAVAPCVLWIDEIEKSLPRARGYVGDSGVSLRVLASFLTWMQERTASVFVFATANEIEQLPPEALRKGRFDEIFFVNLPNARERREILAIHLRQTGRDPAAFDLDRLVSLSGPDTLGPDIAYTGAELAAWINEALIRAFNRRQKGEPGAELDMEDFEAQAAQIVPLAKMRASEVAELRRWAGTHAINASAPDDFPETPSVIALKAR